MLYCFLLFSSGKAVDLAQDCVQDAFVIAVEQQARDRLERLTALNKITPVDMTKLSQVQIYLQVKTHFIPHFYL